MRRLFLILFICSFLCAHAQGSGVVAGKILDAELRNEPLLMVSVTLKNMDRRTQTNFNGNFEFTGIRPGQYVLELSFLGYDTVSLPIAVTEENTTYITHSLKAKTMTIVDFSESTSKRKE